MVLLSRNVTFDHVMLSSMNEVYRHANERVTSPMPNSTTDKHASRKRDKVRGGTEQGTHKQQKGLRYKGEADEHKRKKHKRKHDHKVTDDDEDGWIEKNIDGETVSSFVVLCVCGLITTFPFAQPQNTLNTEPQSSQTGEQDFFSSFGTERKRKEAPERPNPDKVCSRLFHHECLAFICLM